MDSISDNLSSTVTEDFNIGTTGNTGTSAAHYHFDVNAHGITTGAVFGTDSTFGVGQNPAAFFPDIAPDE